MLGRQALRLRLPYQRSFKALDRQQIAHQFGFCLFARFMRLRGLVVGFSIDLGIEPLYDDFLVQPDKLGIAVSSSANAIAGVPMLWTDDCTCCIGQAILLTCSISI